MKLERMTRMNYSGLSEEIDLDSDKEEVVEAVKEAQKEKDCNEKELIDDGSTIWQVSWSDKSESVQVHYFRPIGTFTPSKQQTLEKLQGEASK